jgi:hypothetical protein
VKITTLTAVFLLCLQVPAQSAIICFPIVDHFAPKPKKVVYYRSVKQVKPKPKKKDVLCELIEQYTDKKSGEDCVIIEGTVPQFSPNIPLETNPASRPEPDLIEETIPQFLPSNDPSETAPVRTPEPNLAGGLLLLPLAGLIFSKGSKKSED